MGLSGPNGPVRAKVYIWDLQNFYIPILTFQNETFETSLTSLGPVVQILGVKSQLFCKMSLFRTFRAGALGQFWADDQINGTGPHLYD